MKETIYRQDAIDALDTGLWGVKWDKALATAILKDLPSAQRKGHWVEVYEDDRKQIFWWGCSICKSGLSWKANYCPNCGASMEWRGEEDAN